MIDLRPYAAKLVRPCGVGTTLPAGRLLSLPRAVPLPGRLLHPLRRRGRRQELQASATAARKSTCAPAAPRPPSPKRATPASSPSTRSRSSSPPSPSRPVGLPLRRGHRRDRDRPAASSTPPIPPAEVTDRRIHHRLLRHHRIPRGPDRRQAHPRTAPPAPDTIDYAYQCREAESPAIALAEALVPQVDTRLTMRPDGRAAAGYFREGFAFSPMYTIGIKKKITGKGELRTWLKVEKAS